MITKAQIIEAYLFLREHNHTIPNEVIEFMKSASLERLAADKYNPGKSIRIEYEKGAENREEVKNARKSAKALGLYCSDKRQYPEKSIWVETWEKIPEIGANGKTHNMK